MFFKTLNFKKKILKNTSMHFKTLLPFQKSPQDGSKLHFS